MVAVIGPPSAAPLTEARSAYWFARFARSRVRRRLVEHGRELSLRRVPSRGHVLARQLVGLVVLQDLAGDGDAVHLVGTVVEASGPGVAVHRFQREVRRVAEGAVDLDGAVDDVVEDL